eukprot:10597-Heterococcus_DN1.PRE.2
MKCYLLATAVLAAASTARALIAAADFTKLCAGAVDYEWAPLRPDADLHSAALSAVSDPRLAYLPNECQRTTSSSLIDTGYTTATAYAAAQVAIKKHVCAATYWPAVAGGAQRPCKTLCTDTVLSGGPCKGMQLLKLAVHDVVISLETVLCRAHSIMYANYTVM